MGEVVPGLERLLAEGSGAAGLRPGARIGLLAHPASVDRSCRHAVDLLAEHPEFRLVLLFGPEHGLRGEAQDMEAVGDGVDRESGLPVRSLYGVRPDSLRPRRRDLEGLDAVVCDLQDVGARYYTFAYTLSHVMEAAGEAGVPVVVLDRPNPLGGIEVEGPVLDPALASFVGRYPIPVRHGLTLGELARLLHDVFGIECDLRVVAASGWSRAMEFEETGLPWVAPSPNMPTPATACVYPGGCLVEGTNLSEGRGTTRPFELVGAPWLSPSGLASALSGLGIAGAAFRAVVFRPEFHKHAGKACGGVQVHVLDRKKFRPFASYLLLLREARTQDPDSFRWREKPYEFESSRPAIDLLLGRSELRPMIEAGAELEEMERVWRDELTSFLELRRRVLLYPD